MCGKLKRWLYGMRGAAQAWETLYAEKLGAVGFEQGVSSPAVFYNPTTEPRLVVHGDDFTLLAYADEIEKLKQMMSSWFDVKVRGAAS